MAKITNYARGSRGITLKDGSIVWLDPGQSADIKKDDIAGPLPDLGREPEEPVSNDDEVSALTAQVADLTKQVEALTTERDGLAKDKEDLTKQVEALTKPVDTKK